MATIAMLILSTCFLSYKFYFACNELALAAFERIHEPKNNASRKQRKRVETIMNTYKNSIDILGAIIFMKLPINILEAIPYE